MPSRATLQWLAATALPSSLVCFVLLAADYNCGAQSWDCATFAGIAVVSVVWGLGIGLLLTAGVVLLGWCYLLFRPSKRPLEGKSRSVTVAFSLAVMHLLVFGVMQVMGTLPLGWIWWLGAFGAIGMHPAGTGYFVPSQ
jgi:hypothetical protein